MWIQWIHSYFIKNNPLKTVQIPKAASWVVRKILATRELVLRSQHYQGSLAETFAMIMKEESYSIQRLYLALMPDYAKVN